MAKNIMDQKLRECREMIIQNMENSLQHKMMYMFLKENKIESQVEKFSVIGKDGIIKLTF